jgi:hypothetical protein
MENCLTKTSAYFSKTDVHDFLQRSELTYAATCWAADHGISGKVDTMVAAQWFDKYFVNETGYTTFMQMEVNLTAYLGNL